MAVSDAAAGVRWNPDLFAVLRSTAAVPLALLPLLSSAMVPQCREKGLTVLPIHDAVICKTSEAEMARAIMLRHWTDALGFEPLVRIKGNSPLATAA